MTIKIQINFSVGFILEVLMISNNVQIQIAITAIPTARKKRPVNILNRFKTTKAIHLERDSF